MIIHQPWSKQSLLWYGDDSSGGQASKSFDDSLKLQMALDC